MPELPEMENYRILLNEKISGKIITSVTVNREKSVNVPPDLFAKTVHGQRVEKVTRKAKHLLFHLENGRVLLLHLMLGGILFYGREEEKPDRTIQVKISFGENHLYFIGLRLGYLHLYKGEEVNEILSSLGPEPLEADFTLESFRALLIKKRGRLKSKMVDQSFISGIGNCYSDEICFDAGVLPFRNIQDFQEEEISLLYSSILRILRKAINDGGYMEMPFFKGDTKTGGYNNLCLVYARENEKCFRCSSIIKKEMISSRKVFYCPVCQH
ncbi:Fpg/Nei family DNA glycosylase [Neobacillus terrae]|uniref:Fpg/Nei family DNA glycosylase n=1 Tax=Neobacillus terrae TaxID=3034837 RepID=UPI00140B123D|nr:Fpg/Nei family DNA glycosylase [Neobacillus terrae]NHM33773.1 Fpg/Nei family DNA glycosylase [Neobacillus terrae]